MNKPKFVPPTYLGIPLSPDDAIYIESITGLNNCVLNIQGTAVNLTGDIVNFSEILNVATPGTLFTKVISLGYSFLLSVSVTSFNITLPDGDCFVRCSLINPTSVAPYLRRKILDQGYVSTYSGIGYGTGSVLKRVSDPWFFKTIELANPSAGQNFRYDIPSFIQIFLYAISYTFATSAAVAARYPQIDLYSTVGVVNSYTSDYNQAASSTVRISFNDTSRTSSIIGSSVQCAFGPILLGPSCSIRTAIFNIQAADQISNLAIYCKVQTIPSAY